MNYKYSPKAERDLRWFRAYYRNAFPQGKRSAQQLYLQTLETLLDNPKIGRSVEDFPGAREFTIQKTPFSFIYFIEENELRIVRVFDQRSEFANQRVSS